MLAVDEHGCVDLSRPALQQVLDTVDEGAARVEHIVDEKNDLVFQCRQFHIACHRVVQRSIFVHGHASLEHRNRRQFFDSLGQGLTHRQSLSVYANEHQLRLEVVVFEHFSCHPVQFSDHGFMGHHQIFDRAHACKFG